MHANKKTIGTQKIMQIVVQCVSRKIFVNQLGKYKVKFSNIHKSIV